MQAADKTRQRRREFAAAGSSQERIGRTAAGETSVGPRSCGRLGTKIGHLAHCRVRPSAAMYHKFYAGRPSFRVACECRWPMRGRCRASPVAGRPVRR